MKSLHTILLFLWLFYLNKSEVFADHLRPSCVPNRSGDVYCQNMNLSTIPKYIFKPPEHMIYKSRTLSRVLLDENQITVVPRNLFSQYFVQHGKQNQTIPHCMFTLNLNRNNISKIENGAFDKEPGCLRALILANNKLTKLDSEVFKPLLKLETLVLSFNNIQTIKKNNFPNSLKSLNVLALNDCKIRNIEPFAFASLENLRLLDIGGNLLVSFQPNMFQGLKKLMTLDISYLPTYKVNDSVFKDVPEKCQISRHSRVNLTAQTTINGIPSDPVFIPGGEHTWFVNEPDEPTCTISSYCYIHLLSNWKAKNYSTFDSTKFENFRMLNCTGSPNILLNQETSENDTEIDETNMVLLNNLFSEKMIYKSNGSVFPICIQHFSLVSNNISKIMDDAFKGEPGCMEYLDLSENQLDEIPTKALTPLKTLTGLNLSGNKFSVLTANSFEKMETLDFINLSYCQIETIEPMAFQNLPKLRDILLNGNNFTQEITQKYLGVSNTTQIDSDMF